MRSVLFREFGEKSVSERILAARGEDVRRGLLQEIKPELLSTKFFVLLRMEKEMIRQADYGSVKVL